jgi:hypothetical protein
MSSARAVVASAALALAVGSAACGSSSAPNQSAPAASTPGASAPAAPPPVASSSSQSIASEAEWTKPIELTDAEMPPLPVTPFPPARSMDVVRAVYLFAARRPDVLSHVPCFCGCESRGHRHNDDCFVASRDARGRPTAWEPHGIG